VNDGGGGTPRIDSAADIRRFFSASGKHVIEFAGFGELGYDEPGIVEHVARQVLAPWPPDGVIVACSTLLRAGGQDGIAGVYPVARQLGIETAGLHPSIALGCATTHPVSPFCQRAFFVEDASWGGFVEGTRELSASLRVLLDVSDELVLIGGGKHAADELQAFLAHGKPVRYFPAAMNRAVTDEWCRRAGVSIVDYRGAAHAVWLSRGEGGPGA
jgi:hypothetical protein